MTDAGIPPEIQAAVLGASLDDIKSQIFDYHDSGAPVVFTGFSVLSDQGLSLDQIQQVEAALTAYSTQQHAADPDNTPFIKTATLSNVTMDGAGTGQFIYRCDLLLDNTPYKLNIEMGEVMGNITLTDANSNNPIVLNQSDDD